MSALPRIFETRLKPAGRPLALAAGASTFFLVIATAGLLLVGSAKAPGGALISGPLLVLLAVRLFMQLPRPRWVWFHAGYLSLAGLWALVAGDGDFRESALAALVAVPPLACIRATWWACESAWGTPVFRDPTSPACDFCGYDLTGNATGTCPECGHPAEAPA